MASFGKSSTDHLPKQFVESMKVLFNILDEKGTGQISIEDIKSRWQDGNVTDLPPGVLPALMKMTQSNGYINFDRFVAGLQIALLRQRHTSEPQEPDLIADHKSVIQTTATVHPNNAMAKHNSGSLEGLTELQSGARNLINQHNERGVNSHWYNSDIQAGHPVERPQQMTRSQQQRGQSINQSQQSNNQRQQQTGPSHQMIGQSQVQQRLGLSQQSQGPAAVNSNFRPSNQLPSRRHWKPEDQKTMSSQNNMEPPPPVPRRTIPREDRYTNNMYPKHASYGSAIAIEHASTNDINQHPTHSNAANSHPRPTSLSQGPHAVSTSHSSHSVPSLHTPHSVQAAARDNPSIDNGPTSTTTVPHTSAVIAELTAKNLVHHRHKSVNMYGRRAMTPTNLSSGTSLTNDVFDRQLLRGNKENVMMASNQKRPEGKVSQDDSSTVAVGYQRRGGRKHREQPRRHTVTGVDYGLLRRMKQFEDERDLYVQGLECVQKVMEWYQQQLSTINHNLQHQTFGDLPIESNQERIDNETAYIHDINNQLKALMDGSYTNKRVNQNCSVNREEYEALESRIAVLKAQNKLLTRETNKKSDRMSQLEREKSSLIRELFDLKADQHHTKRLDDTTFM